ncbi:hypothetical protein ACFW2D_14395 [Streptomyces sp. NPDC058914]|uniref:hypothetical protein n=1 Tax=Streptomyces sp. NPDC058914 TaxID=3346671 RepID=UPI00369476B7
MTGVVSRLLGVGDNSGWCPLHPVPLEEGGDQAYMIIGELPGAVFRAGPDEPGTDLDGDTVDADDLAGSGSAAFTAEQELQELDGLGEGAAGTTEGGELVAVEGAA